MDLFMTERAAVNAKRLERVKTVCRKMEESGQDKNWTQLQHKTWIDDEAKCFSKVDIKHGLALCENAKVTVTLIL